MSAAAERVAAGDGVEAITLSLGRIRARILTLGASLAALEVPDREGRLDDVVLGHDTAAEYRAHRGFLGATIGRYANRIAGGRFAREGTVHQVAPNDGPNALHGGADGFDRRDWEVMAVSAGATPEARLRLVSPDGDQGFPGRLEAELSYRLVEEEGEARLEIEMAARTDRPTPVNMTNHAFFNLEGNLASPELMRDVMDHRLTIHASRYLPVDATAIPEGGPEPVAGTPFDFRAPRRIGEAIRAGTPQLLRGRGYDHNFCLDGVTDGALGWIGAGPLTLAAEVWAPVSGRVARLWTDQPGLQFYSGNFLDGRVPGKGGVAPRAGDAFCLEPQAWPDSPNRPDFPFSWLEPGQEYRHRTRLGFSAR
ncbi:aldose epimerase family protein [Amaricoccus solimangrovi]|uniref:Aldose 1-epimerase n=1 Tax=Amaricoccus solimangrovi TaxID=2589815 RepID=A0A501WID7_9RHOB|nr:aldose epimerase family protein [Amaricoccus solimangrovi]TPE48532.1 galactose mutarotase [Amaricoccus solimangrovi]